MGVHSPADIVTGGILGGLLLSLYLQIDDQVQFHENLKNFQVLYLDRYLHQSKGHGANCMLPYICSISTVDISRFGCYQPGELLFIFESEELLIEHEFF